MVPTLKRFKRRRGACHGAGIAWAGLLLTSLCPGQTAGDPPSGALLLSGFGEVSNVDGGGGLELRARLPRRFQLGLKLGGNQVRQLYVSGYEAQGTALRAGVFALNEFGVTDPLSLSVRLGAGYHRLSAAESTPAGTISGRVVSDVSLMSHLRLHERAALRVGWLVLVDLQASPEWTMASLGGLLQTGTTVALSEHFSLFGDVQSGGTYGFDGNNEKYVLRGVVGLSTTWGNGGQPWLVY